MTFKLPIHCFYNNFSAPECTRWERRTKRDFNLHPEIQIQWIYSNAKLCTNSKQERSKQHINNVSPFKLNWIDILQTIDKHREKFVRFEPSKSGKVRFIGEIVVSPTTVAELSNSLNCLMCCVAAVENDKPKDAERKCKMCGYKARNCMIILLQYFTVAALELSTARINFGVCVFFFHREIVVFSLGQKDMCTYDMHVTWLVFLSVSLGFDSRCVCLRV